MAFFASTPRVRVGIPGIICALFLPLLFPSAAQPQGIQGRRLDNIYIVAQFNDGYWEWYHQYLQDRDEQRRRITEIRLQLAVLAAERKKLRAEWLKLLYYENRLTPQTQYNAAWSPFWTTVAQSASGGSIGLADEITGVSSPGELAGEVRREIDDIAFRWSAGIWGAPLVAEDTGNLAAVEALYQSQRDELRAEINQWKAVQGELILEALALNQDMSASCLAQKEKSRDRRPWLNAETERLDDELIILEVYLYDAAEWYLPDELPALVAALDLDNTATEEVAALLRAKVALHQAAWNDEKNWLQLTSPRQAPPDPEWVMAARRPRLEAIVDLRRVIALNPENAEARGMLMEVELYWLREIAAKVDLESRASLEAFRQYISARGFYADQPQGWFQPAFEVISAIWGLGPIALTAGLPGLNVAEARAIELDTTQTSAARNQVSLLAIMRLVKNGVSLIEIPSMTPGEVATRMTMHTAEGRPLPRDKATRVVQDIRDTFRDLKDLQLLASADLLYLVEDVNNAFGKVYYAPLDPTYTWYESFGDLLNVHNIALLWGPGSMAKVKDEFGVFKWSTRKWVTPSQLQAMEQAGTLTTKQVFVTGFQLDKLAETIAKTRVGARFGAALAADRAAMASQGTATNLANMGGRLASAMVLYSGATYLGQQNGIPGAGLLVEIIGELGPVDMLSDIAVRAQLPLEQLATRVDEFGEFLVKQKEELVASRRLLDEVSDLAEELSEEAADATRQTAIQTRLVEIVEQIEDNAATRQVASVADPVDQATTAAAEALHNGNLTEAQQAITGAVEIAEGAGTRLDGATAQAAAAAAALSEGVPPSSLVITPPDDMKSLYEIMDEGALTKAWRPDLYAETGPGRSLQLGEEAIRRGELEEAAEHFRAARREILDAGRSRANQAQFDHALTRLDDVVNAQHHRGRMEVFQAATPRSGATTPISEEQATQAMEKFDEAMENLDEALQAGTIVRRGGANPVYVVKDAEGNEYFIKQIVPEPTNDMTKDLTPKDIDRILASEAASYSLAQRVDELERSLAPDGGAPGSGNLGGLNTPATRYDRERGVLISRGIPMQTTMAGELWDFPEHVVLAYRKEYARQRVIRAWLGDSDGHLRNMVLGDDGRLYQIDFDQAVLNGTRSRHLPPSSDVDPSEEDFLAAMFDRFPYVAQGNRDAAMYRMVARMDQMVTYGGDMAPTVAAIRALVDNPADLRRILEQAGVPDVDGALRTLTERAPKLEEVLQPMFDGRLLEMGVASLRRPGSDWIAGLPAKPQWAPAQINCIPIPAVRPLRDELPRAA